MKPKQKKPRGRPAHQPTETLRRQIEMMVAFGNTEGQICQIIGIAEPTLRLHYRAEIDHGFAKANNAVAMNIFRQATKDDPRAITAAMFWMKCRAGWSEYMILPRPGAATPLGKKEQQAEAAAHPDRDTPMGDLMARRQAQTVN